MEVDLETLLALGWSAPPWMWGICLVALVYGARLVWVAGRWRADALHGHLVLRAMGLGVLALVAAGFGPLSSLMALVWLEAEGRILVGRVEQRAGGPLLTWLVISVAAGAIFWLAGIPMTPLGPIGLGACFGLVDLHRMGMGAMGLFGGLTAWMSSLARVEPLWDMDWVDEDEAPKQTVGRLLKDLYSRREP